MSIQANKLWLQTLLQKELRQLSKYYFIENYRVKSRDQLIEELSKYLDVRDRPINKGEMYTRKILEFWDHKLQGKIEQPTHIAESMNETCRDWVKLQAIIKDGIFQDLQFQAIGCCLSEACTAILVDRFRGKSIEVATMSDKDFILSLDIKLTPNRIDCVLLPLKCLRALCSETAKNQN